MGNRLLSLQKAADGEGGERFVIVLESGVEAYASKPMPASFARLALHKLGSSDASIASMMERARGVPDGERRD